MSVDRTLLTEALAQARARASWNDRLAHWERPASNSEHDQISRAAGMVRGALARNITLSAEEIVIEPQGSYHNNTNVRLEADMDLRGVHPYWRVEYGPGVVPQYADQWRGLTSAARTYADVAAIIRREMEAELGKAFGNANVDVSGNKAIRVKKVPGSRADVDIAPMFKYVWVTWDSASMTFRAAEGVSILSKDGRWTNNFPQQHYDNGVAKRSNTAHRFKKVVRMLKSLRDELVTLGSLQKGAVASFLIECLTYAVEDGYFLVEEDDRWMRVRRILHRISALLANPDWVSTATEINEIKYLFHFMQPWSVVMAQTFVGAALARLDA